MPMGAELSSIQLHSVTELETHVEYKSFKYLWYIFQSTHLLLPRPTICVQ